MSKDSNRPSKRDIYALFTPTDIEKTTDRPTIKIVVDSDGDAWVFINNRPIQYFSGRGAEDIARANNSITRVTQPTKAI